MKRINGLKEFDGFLSELDVRRKSSESQARAVAEAIIAGVRERGDVEVSRVLREFDNVSIAPGEISTIRAGGPPALQGALDLAIERVTRFHEQQRATGYTYDENGSRFEHRVRPLRRVGIYVPGGRAVYLSTLIMCAVPAKLAGVNELVVATTPLAAANDDFQYLCARLGISEVYRCGGPAGVAAMALGTETLRRVDKIVGPGNAYVTAAKQLLVGEVGIDMTAGPTEIVLVADASTDLTLAAADLLAQAEHGDDSTVIVVTDAAPVADRLSDEITRQLSEAGESAARVSIPRNGAIVVVDDIADAVRVINAVGPEHVSIQCDESRIDIDAIDDCGAIFIGPFAPVAIGDYIAGPNHVLPTAGAGRFFSPLGVYDFYKRSNVVRLSSATFNEIAGAGAAMADGEGLPLHAASIRARANVREVSC
jgi:histidinol dehydrogenase